MSKRDEEQNATPSASPARGEERNTIREESLEDFSPEWCQNLLNDPSYEQVNHGTRIADGSLNSLIGKTLFTDHTIRAIRVLCKPEDKSKGTSGELLALMSLGDEMCSYPNTLHGGINTTLLGEVGGALAGRQTSSSERITAVNFNVNLRKSVRAPGIVLVRAWMERPPEGRKIWVKCRTEQDGVTCIESENLYLKIFGSASQYKPEIQHKPININQAVREMRRPPKKSRCGVTKRSQCHLTALPTEILAQIVSTLSPKEICRARTLSKFFKAFVDTNQSALLRPSITYHKARIIEDYKALTQTSGLDFSTALCKCIGYYGRFRDVSAREDATLRFTFQYLDNADERAKDQFINFRPETISVIAMWLLHRPENQRNPQPIFKTSALVMLGWEISYLLSPTDGIEIPTLQPMDPATNSQLQESSSFPRFFLTRCRDTIVVPPATRHARCTCTSEDIITWLGLPSMRPSRHFAYCVESHRMWSLVNKAWLKRGTKLSMFEKAALLEEIFIW